MLENLKNFFAAEGAKLKEMTFKEKAAYIWEYYKFPIIAIAAVLLIASSIINSVWINPPKKLYLQIAYYAGYVDDAALTGACAMLEDAIMTPEERQTMQIAGTSFMLNSGDPQMDMAIQQKFAAMIAVNELDLLIVNDADLDSLVSQGMLMPLKDAISGSLPQKLSDKLIEAADENAVKADYAIKLDGNKFFNDNGLPADGLCLGVVVNTKNPDNVKRALEYIFNS